MYRRHLEGRGERGKALLPVPVVGPKHDLQFRLQREKKTLKVRNVATVPKEVIILGIPEKVSCLDKAQLPFSIGANSLSALHEQPGEDTFYQQEKKTNASSEKKKVQKLPGRESNPGLPRDRRRYLPLYYRGGHTNNTHFLT